MATITNDKSPLADDLLRGVKEIAKYTGENVRRQRHLIARHGFPCFLIGGLIYSTKSLARQYYNLDNGAAK